MRSILRFALLVVVLATVVSVAPAAAQSDDVSDQCRTIIGCADAGPAPENPGDRGGYAQLLTLLVIVGGVGFIGWRIVRSARANATATTPAAEPD